MSFRCIKALDLTGDNLFLKGLKSNLFITNRWWSGCCLVVWKGGKERLHVFVIYAFTCATCLHVCLHVDLKVSSNFTSTRELHNCTCVFSIRTEANFLSLSLYQEVILKRAADLVEALYGLPHNNQVGTRRNKSWSSTLSLIIYYNYLCFAVGDHPEACNGHCRSPLQRSKRTHPAFWLQPLRHDGGQLIHWAAVCQRLRAFPS